MKKFLRFVSFWLLLTSLNAANAFDATLENGNVGLTIQATNSAADSESPTVRVDLFSIPQETGKPASSQVFASLEFFGDWRWEISTKTSADVASRFVLENEDERLVFEIPASSDVAKSFVLISRLPLANQEWETVKIVNFWKLPKFQIESSFFADRSLDDLRAFGTAGLKKIDEHSGSYSFLAIVDPETNRGVVAGWLTNRQGNGVLFSAKKSEQIATITAQVDYGRLVLSPEKEIEPETLAIGSFDDARDGLERYADALADRNDVRLKPAPTGYCSWYSEKFGGAGSEDSTAEFADVAREKLVPYGMSYFQIDDKWQLGHSKNGPNKNFSGVRPDGPYPSGLRKTADKLNEAGLIAGLWFMPFSGNFDDPYFADKQDWFVKSAIDYPAPGEKNTRRYSGINQKKGAPYETFWGGTALDTSNPTVQNYIRETAGRIADDWNCRYFKIDGLWVGAGIEQLYVNDEYLPDDIGKQIFFDPEITNIEAYRQGLSLVREAAGDDVYILGCNVSQNMRTLGASVGFVDAMRIGPDNGADWKGICAGPWRGTNRYFYNRRVWTNDPDPVYVRDSIPLSHAQVITSWVALTGQLFAFSDWLPELSAERIDVLRRTTPNHQLKTARPVDLFTEDLARVWTLTNKTADVEPEDARFVVGMFNWNEKDETNFDSTPEKLGLPLQKADGSPIEKYIGFDFWKREFLPIFGNAAEVKTLQRTVPGGACSICAVRPVLNRPILVGSSRNVTQGIYEVLDESWNAETETLSITIDPRKAALGEELPYELFVYSPFEIVAAVEKALRMVDIETDEPVGGWVFSVNLTNVDHGTQTRVSIQAAAGDERVRTLERPVRIEILQKRR